MSAVELKGIKHNLVDWINHFSDTELISFLDGIRLSRAKKDWWDELSDSQKSQVLVGLKDADKGNLVSSETFWDKLKNA